MEKRTLIVIMEKGDDEEIGARIESDDFLLTTVGASESEVIRNMREVVEDFLNHEGADNPSWEGVKIDDIEFTIEYDLTALFSIFSALKINSIAELAGINKGLMRQYASGVKSVSQKQAKKIESAIRQLGERLTHVAIA